MRTSLLALATILPLIATSTLSTPALAMDQQGGSISVTGTGRIEMTPDMATISAGVQSQAKSAKEALADNNAKMAALFETLKKAGIAKKDIQTSNFNIHPQMVYPKSGSNEPPRITGYNVNNQVTVIIRKLDMVGSALTALVESGANNMSGLHFGVSDKEEKLDEARKAALADARAKATLYATELGTTLKRLSSMSESGGLMPQPIMLRAAKMDMAASSVPVAEGSMTLSVSVSTIWEMAK